MKEAGPSLSAQFTGRLGAFSLDVAFEAPMRGITALFGPSGCGKTTVLRCVAGLNRLSGRLTVQGETWQDDDARIFRKPHHRPVGYIFQEASLFPHLSTRDNLLFGRKRAARNGDGDDGLDVDDVIDLLGLSSLLDRSTTRLSGGERQRVALGRALLSRPRLLLMDEPLSALDRMSKDEILPYFETLHQTLSIPILYVSHDIGEVARLADRVVLLASGRTIAAGPVQEIFERLDLGPATGRFEAGVVLTARVAAHDPRYRLTHLDHHGQGISIPAVDIGVNEQIRVRIRARDVALTLRKPEAISIRNILSGSVAEIAEDTETAYAEVLVDIGGGKLRARLTRESVADLALAPGVPVYALIKSISFDGRAIGGPAAAPRPRRWRRPRL